jgi:hypothetical protein
LDPLRLATASNNWQPQTIQIILKESPNVKIELVIQNFKTLSGARPTDANEKSVKDLTSIMLEEKSKKLAELRIGVSRISASLSNLQLAINLKILLLKKQNKKTIYEGQIKIIEVEKTKCLQEKDRLLKENDDIEMKWVETQSNVEKFTEEINTCRGKVEALEIEIISIGKKIDTTVQEEEKRLLANNKEAYTHIFYWLEATFYYRVFSSKLVANVDEVAVKFAENKIKPNSIKLSEVFYPLETDLSFFE